jgi:3-deoxy-D-manno-octulosonic-acid transferase
LQPDLVIFVKYEFWFRHLQAAKEFGAKIMLTAGIFRANQYFFRKNPAFFRKVLTLFDHFFLQNKPSADLLQQAGFDNYSVTGDPRFDRVLAIADDSAAVKGIDTFKNKQPLLICGSTWPTDESIVIKYALRHPGIKMIIAPHEIHSEHLISIEHQLNDNYIRYSDLDENNATSVKYLIIDNIGMLSKLYRYADLCYIGGGFGAGIHNTLEAAVYGKPLIFGPKYKKFSEALDLIEEGAAFSIRNYDDAESILNSLFRDENMRNYASKKAKLYCESKRGSTEKTITRIAELTAFLPK